MKNNLKSIVEHRNGGIYMYNRNYIVMPDGSEIACQNDLNEVLDVLQTDQKNGLPIKITCYYR